MPMNLHLKKIDNAWNAKVRVSAGLLVLKSEIDHSQQILKSSIFVTNMIITTCGDNDHRMSRY